MRMQAVSVPKEIIMYVGLVVATVLKDTNGVADNQLKTSVGPLSTFVNGMITTMNASIMKTEKDFSLVLGLKPGGLNKSSGDIGII